MSAFVRAFQLIQPMRSMSQKTKLNQLYCVCPASEVLGVSKTTFPSGVSVSTVSWPTTDTPKIDFDIDCFFSVLKTKKFGRVLLYGEEVTSTQTILTETDLPAGTVFAASTQVHGKGRGDNKWQSPAGALMFSLKCSLRSAERLPFVQYIVSLAIIDCVKSKDPKLDVWIKWPNDVYTSKGVKIGGVLCQSSFKDGVFDICVGVGINVSNKEPTTCLNELSAAVKTEKTDTSPSTEIKQSEQTYTRQWVLASFLNTFENYMTDFEKKGFGPFLKQYTSQWLHSDQIVTLGEKDKKAMIKGLTENGYLLACDPDDTSTQYELHPDGNSFDFLKGLVINKVVKKQQ